MESARLRARRAPPGARRGVGAGQPGGAWSSSVYHGHDEVARAASTRSGTAGTSSSSRSRRSATSATGALAGRSSTCAAAPVRSSSTRSGQPARRSRATRSCGCRASAPGRRPSLPQASRRVSTFSAWMPRWAFVSRPSGSVSLAALQRVQVVHVLVEDAQRRVAVVRRRRGPGTTVSRPPPAAPAGPASRGSRPASRPRDPRDLHVRQVVAARPARRCRAIEQRHAVVGVALGGVQLELAVADLQLARHRQRLHLAERRAAAARST